jgi:hypothetical protein
MRTIELTSMPPHMFTTGTKRRTGATIYLRSDLKSSARQAARKAGLSLSRHIESLLMQELEAYPLGPISPSNRASTFDSSTNPPSKTKP